MGPEQNAAVYERALSAGLAMDAVTLRVGDLEQIVAHEPVPPLGAAVLVTRRGTVVGVVAPPDADLLKLAERLRSLLNRLKRSSAPTRFRSRASSTASRPRTPPRPASSTRG